MSVPGFRCRGLVRGTASEEPLVDSAVLDRLGFDLDRAGLSLAGCVSCFFESVAVSDREFLSRGGLIVDAEKLLDSVVDPT